MEKEIKALALNGGGIRILIQIETLIELEKVTGVKCKDYFDYMGGTSGGAIIVALLATGYTAEEVKTIILNDHKNIFKKRFWLSTGAIKSKYRGKAVKKAMSKYLANVSMKDLDCNIVIPTINSELYQPNFFKTGKDQMLLDGVIASAAAPIYFPKYKIGKYYHEDGGMGYNNPSEVLRNEIFRDHGVGTKYHLLNVTTGSKMPKKISKRSANGGLLYNILPTVDILLHMQDIRTHGAMSFVHKADSSEHLTSNEHGTYCRIGSLIQLSSGSIDDNSEDNIEMMNLDGIATVNRYRQIIEKFVLCSTQK